MAVETKETPEVQDIPLEKGQSSEKVTPKKEKTYSETEYLKAVSDEKTISGRLKTQLDETVKEKDSLKSQAKEATDTLEETRQHISNLESDIDAFEENETDPNKLSKLRKELKEAKGKVAKSSVIRKLPLRY